MSEYVRSVREVTPPSSSEISEREDEIDRERDEAARVRLSSERNRDCHRVHFCFWVYYDQM
ncbi:hypothetical protein L195_g038544 [Trifolium pratense]|uniref:Uncharacterized protein n=1 Tax=Trifolium pratense TaxID=57577 RepID=A0A2K3LVF7_TRIPR|nr:hypothetical protein L195_g038544 [Trifolium pratense]